MELRHLRVFLALADELHFGKAAARLHVAQSAVSQALRGLEEEVGAKLFERTRRHVALTNAGASFRQHAAQALLEVERAASSAHRAGRGETGQLSLRFTLMSALTVLPRAVARFQAAFPEVALKIEPGGTTEQLEAISTGRCDIGFVTRKGDLSPLASELVEKAPLVALVSTRNPLARRKQIDLADLADARLVFLRQASEPEVRMKFRARCLAAGFDPNVVVEVEQLEVLLAFVAADVGVSCVPALARRVPFPGVKIVPFTSGVEGGISMVWHPARLSPAAQQFLSMVRQERDADSVSRRGRARHLA